MSALISNTKSELYKLVIRKKYIVIAVIAALVCILRLGGSVLISKVSGGEIVIKSNLIMEMMGFITDILNPLVVFMAVCDLFSSEAQEDTLKASLMRPLTRFKVLTSKSLAAFFMGCITMMAMFVICFIIQLVSGSGLSAVPHALVAYLINLIPIFSLVALALCINMLSKSPTLAMLLCIVVYVVFKYINYYISPLGQMIFTAYTQWHRIWIGASLPPAALMSKAGILFGSVLILYTVSYIIFDRKDY